MDKCEKTHSLNPGELALMFWPSVLSEQLLKTQICRVHCQRNVGEAGTKEFWGFYIYQFILSQMIDSCIFTYRFSQVVFILVVIMSLQTTLFNMSLNVLHTRTGDLCVCIRLNSACVRASEQTEEHHASKDRYQVPRL